NRAITGKIGAIPVRMVLDYFEGSISGTYYYDSSSNPSVRNWLTNLQLHGKVDNDGRFEMSEESCQFDEPASKKTGTFKGVLKLDRTSPRPLIHMEGTWSSPD